MPPALRPSMAWKTLLVLLTACLLVEKGQGSNVLCSPNEFSAGEEADVSAAVGSLQSGQTLLLEKSEVRLDSTLVIAASNVVVRGAQGTTMVHCPAEGGAFVIAGRNVTLEHLVITGCSDTPAVAVEGANSASIQEEAVHRSPNSQKEALDREWSVTLKDCSFHGNRAANGSAVHAVGDSVVKIERSTFVDSIASEYGGSIFVGRASLTVVDSFFRNSSSKQGGAVYSKGGFADFRNCSFLENKAVRGGGVYGIDGSMDFSDCFFLENTAKHGGAVYGVGGPVDFSDCSFLENTARAGGAVYREGGGSADFSKCSFRKNKVIRDGGAVYSFKGSVNLRNCSFRDNSAAYDGGAIWMDNIDACKDTCFHMKQSVLKRNSARIGGAIRIAATSSKVSSCLFARNNATDSGGAMTVASFSYMAIEGRTNFTHNRARTGGGCSFSEGALVRFGSSLMRGSNATSISSELLQFGLERLPFYRHLSPHEPRPSHDKAINH